MTSLLLVEDHAMLAEVIANMLCRKGHFEVAGIALTADEALEMLPGLAIDLVLVDVSLPRISGIELVSLIAERFPHLPCLMLSGHATKHYVDLSLEAGARGYVVKDDLDGIVEGIHRVLEGDIYLSKQIASS